MRPSSKFLLLLNALGGVQGSTNVPDAPVLAWTSAPTDNTPNYTVDLPSGVGAPHDAASGDIIYLEEADNISFVTTSTSTLDAGAVSGDIVPMESVLLADGVYYARARLKRGSSYGAYSNVVTVTISTAANRLMWGASQQLWSTDHLTWT